MANGGFTFMPTARLVLAVNGDYSMNKGDFEPVRMPEPPASVADSIDQNIEAANYDYSMIHTYSDMSYKLLRASVNASYSIGKNIQWSGELTYLKFTDDTGYVFGNETGSFYVLRSGLAYNF